MYLDRFNYYRANDLDEAIKLLSENGSDTKILAGGLGLLSMMRMQRMHPRLLIDIEKIDNLRGVRKRNHLFSIDTLTTVSEVSASKDLWENLTALAEATSQVGDVQIRNLATIGGNIAEANPSSDICAAFLALKGEIIARGREDERVIEGKDFFHGSFKTNLKPDEIITELRIPIQGKLTGSAYIKFRRFGLGYPVVGIAALIEVEKSNNCLKVVGARFVATGILDRVVRLKAVERVLINKEYDERDVEIIDTTILSLEGINISEIRNDSYATSKYRAHLLDVLTRRALVKAMKRALSNT